MRDRRGQGEEEGERADGGSCGRVDVLVVKSVAQS